MAKQARGSLQGKSLLSTAPFQPTYSVQIEAVGSRLQSLRMSSGTECRFRGDGLAMGKASPH
ncbi:unnamed protein product [Leuciscus chuanchicus]